MALTDKDIYYPTSGDNIAPLETHFATLAQSVDDAIVVLEEASEAIATDLETLDERVGVIPQSGTTVFSGPTAAATPVNVSVTFPLGGYFSAEPVVTATVAGSSTASAYFPVLHTITTSGFQARIWRTTGTTAETLTLQWNAAE
jgi:hypothetical protein